MIGRSTVAQGRVTCGSVYRKEELAGYQSFKELLDSYSVNSCFTVAISYMIFLSLRELLSTSVAGNIIFLD